MLRCVAARRWFTSALLVSCMAWAPTQALAAAPSSAPATSSAAPRPRIDGPFAHAVCAMAFEFGVVTGKWDLAMMICQIAQAIDPMDD